MSSSRTLAASFSKPTLKRSLHTSNVIKSSEGLGKVDLSKFSFERLKEMVYVLDTRLTIRLGAFLIPSIVMTGLWTMLRVTDNEKGLDVLDRHFTPTLKNLQEGRIYTLFTSAYGANGVITGGGLAESCTFLLFGGNLLRSFGFTRMMAIYLFGHAVFTSTYLYFNWSQHRDIVKYEENLANPGTHPELTYTPRRDRRAMVLAIGRQTNEANPGSVKDAEERQRNLIKMEEPEFLEAAKNYYLNRPAVTVGGGLLWAMLGLRLHPLSVIPMPYVPVPILFFVPIQLWACLSAFDAYPREELILSLAPLAMSAFIITYVLPRGNLHRQLPIELVDSMKMPKFVPRHIPDTRVEDAARAASQAYELAKKINLPQTKASSAQIDAMRKRNAKFQNKK